MSKCGFLVNLGSMDRTNDKEKIFRHPVFRFHSQVDLESVNFTVYHKISQTWKKTRSFISKHALNTQQNVTQKNHCERKHVPLLKLLLQKRKRTMSKNATQHSPQGEVKQTQLNKSTGRHLRKKISIEFLV